MAYTHGSPYRGNVTRVLCDTCAETEVPFNRETGQQESPWCWMPLWGGLPSLTKEECEKEGISEHERLGLCDKCFRRC